MGKRKDAVLAIDIGGSKLVAGLVADDGEILCKEKTGWARLDGDSVMRTIFEVSERMLADHKGVRVRAIGANIPGLADADKGLWVEACFSGIRNVPIAAQLTKRFRLPAYIDNDVNNCALAEKLFGVCRDCTDFAWLTVSNGCGGALFLNNRVYRGVHGTAGEFGHIIVEENGGYPCGCGNTGCLEAQAAGPGIVRRFVALGGPENTEGIPIDASKIAELAKTGDSVAKAVFEREGYYIGKAISAVINATNPQKIVVGGGVAGSFDLFYPELLKTVSNMTYREASKQTTIEKTGLGYDAALVGAAALALVHKRMISYK